MILTRFFSVSDGRHEVLFPAHRRKLIFAAKTRNPLHVLEASVPRSILGEYYAFTVCASTHRQGLQPGTRWLDGVRVPPNRRQTMPSDTHTRSRVLCVDDDLDACEMLSALLKSHRIEVTCAQSATEAWPLI